MILAATEPCDWCGEPIGRRTRTAYPGATVLCRDAACLREFTADVARRRATARRVTPEGAAALARGCAASVVAQAKLATVLGQRHADPLERQVRIAQAVMDGALEVVRAVAGGAR